MSNASVGIEIVVGAPGEGKTLFAVEDMAYNPGRIVSTIRLTPKHPAYHRAEYLHPSKVLQVFGEGKNMVARGFWEYPALRGVHYVRNPETGQRERRGRGYTLYVDEADIHFDCAENPVVRPYVSKFMKQHRKREIRIVFIVQSVENLNVRIRRLAQSVILCHKDSSGRIGWMPGFMQRFVRVRYASARMLKPIRQEFMLERNAKEVFTWYDTNELIGAGDDGEDEVAA